MKINIKTWCKIVIGKLKNYHTTKFNPDIFFILVWISIVVFIEHAHVTAVLCFNIAYNIRPARTLPFMCDESGY